MKYACSKCGASKRKMWRRYNPFQGLKLLCRKCTEHDQGTKMEAMSDHIGGWVPAIFSPPPDQKGVLLANATPVADALVSAEEMERWDSLDKITWEWKELFISIVFLIAISSFELEPTPQLFGCVLWAWLSGFFFHSYMMKKKGTKEQK